MSAYKTTILDLAGNPKKHMLVRERDVSTSAASKGRRHHIAVVDRSGSMYHDMADLKTSLKKVLALHEYHDDDMLFSLISYSSAGDMTVHFTAKPVSQIDVSEIDRLRATSLTCISQALETLVSIIDPSHVTGITLHSDGYANDPSSYSEKRSIFAACEALASQNVFVNTISHSDYSDFQLLSAVANKVSGRCVKVTGIKGLYDSIVQTFETLNSGNLSKAAVELDGDDYLVYISSDEQKIIGSDSDLDLAGINSTSPGSVFGFKEVSAAEYGKSQFSELSAHQANYAFARAMLA